MRDRLARVGLALLVAIGLAGVVGCTTGPGDRESGKVLGVTRLDGGQCRFKFGVVENGQVRTTYLSTAYGPDRCRTGTPTAYRIDADGGLHVRYRVSYVATDVNTGTSEHACAYFLKPPPNSDWPTLGPIAGAMLFGKCPNEGDARPLDRWAPEQNTATR